MAQLCGGMPHPLTRGRHVPGVCWRQGSLTGGDGGTPCEWASNGFWDHFHEWRVECGEVLNREGDVITLTGTVFAVVSSVAEKIAKV